MKVVVLDAHTLDPGDLSRAAIEELRHALICDQTPYENVADRPGGAEVVLTNKTTVDRAAIEGLPALRSGGRGA